MPDLVKLLIRHALIGFALAIVLVGSLWLFNIGHFADLVANDGPVAVVMLTAFSGFTFASAQMGIAVMTADEDDHDHADPGSMLAAVSARIWAFARAKS